MVLDQLLQGGERLRVLQKGDAPGVEQLKRLHDESISRMPPRPSLTLRSISRI